MHMHKQLLSCESWWNFFSKQNQKPNLHKHTKYSDVNKKQLCNFFVFSSPRVISKKNTQN